MWLANIWALDNLQKSYDEANQMIIKTTQLTHPDLQAPIALTMDASDHTAEAALEQFSDKQDKAAHPPATEAEACQKTTFLGLGDRYCWPFARVIGARVPTQHFILDYKTF